MATTRVSGSRGRLSARYTFVGDTCVGNYVLRVSHGVYPHVRLAAR